MEFFLLAWPKKYTHILRASSVSLNSQMIPSKTHYGLHTMYFPIKLEFRKKESMTQEIEEALVLALQELSKRARRSALQQNGLHALLGFRFLLTFLGYFPRW